MRSIRIKQYFNIVNNEFRSCEIGNKRPRERLITMWIILEKGGEKKKMENKIVYLLLFELCVIEGL